MDPRVHKRALILRTAHVVLPWSAWDRTVNCLWESF